MLRRHEVLISGKVTIFITKIKLCCLVVELLKCFLVCVSKYRANKLHTRQLA